jgi:Domain of unknown function (DUF4375)
VSIRNEEKVVLFVERFRDSVASDGFEGFLHAEDADDVQAMLNALLVMKAVNTAALLRRAMWLFEDGVPPRERHARLEALRQIGETGRSVFHQLDGSFRRYTDELTSSLGRDSRSLDERCCIA